MSAAAMRGPGTTDPILVDVPKPDLPPVEDQAEQAGEDAALASFDLGASAESGPINPIELVDTLFGFTGTLLGARFGDPEGYAARMHLSAQERSILEMTRPGLDELIGDDWAFLKTRTGAAVVLCALAVAKLAGPVLELLSKRKRSGSSDREEEDTPSQVPGVPTVG